eukprot:6208831-Pleurochrysis_carterae.AAC.2
MRVRVRELAPDHVEDHLLCRPPVGLNRVELGAHVALVLVERREQRARLRGHDDVCLYRFENTWMSMTVDVCA